MSNWETALVLGIIIIPIIILLKYRTIEAFLFNRKNDENFKSIGFGGICWCVMGFSINFAIKLVYWFSTKTWIPWTDFSSTVGFVSNILPYIAALMVIFSLIEIILEEKTVKRKIFRCIFTLFMVALTFLVGMIVGYLYLFIFILWWFIGGIRASRRIKYY